MRATKNIGVAYQKQNFKFNYAVVKYRLHEKYGNKERTEIITCLVNFLLLKLMSLNEVLKIHNTVLSTNKQVNVSTHCRVSFSPLFLSLPT